MSISTVCQTQLFSEFSTPPPPTHAHVCEGTGTSAWTEQETLSAWHIYSLVRIYDVLLVLVLTELLELPNAYFCMTH
jgi:hypothetical protein